MKIKTSELTDAALDYAVAKAEGGMNFMFDGITWSFELDGRTKVLAKGWAPSMCFCPSTDWSQGGPIKTKEKISTQYRNNEDDWLAVSDIGCYALPKQRHHATAKDELIAAMRCFVASKLGDEVDVPEELLK